MPSPAVQETIRQTPYRFIIEAEMRRNHSLQEQFAYDRGGNLFFRRFNLPAAYIYEAYGAPFDSGIQVTDTTIITKRIFDLQSTVDTAAKAVRYPKRVRIHFATKANQESAMVTTAAQSADLEGTSPLDVENCMFLWKNGFIPRDRIFIFNGYKHEDDLKRDIGYDRRIIEFHNQGAHVIPVLEPGELRYFGEAALNRPMEVGIRLKFGPVNNLRDLEHYTSQFGHSWKDAQETAYLITQYPNLRFTMLHAMQSAAETIPPHEWVKNALFAMELYADLKSRKTNTGKMIFPDLSELNIGGGIPSFGSGYPFQEVLQPYFAGVMRIAEKFRIEPPKIVIESGTFIANDAQHLIWKIFHHQRNDANGITQVAFNGSIFTIPDVFVLHASFPILAARFADYPAIPVRITDRTCDSNDVMPSKYKPHESILLPSVLKGQYIVIANTGAYESVLGGQGADSESMLVGHCGNADPINVVVWERNGQIEIESNKSPTVRELSNLLGFNHSLRKHFPKR